MTEATMLEQVQDLMSRLFDLDRAALGPDQRLLEDLDLTSLDALDLAIELQNVTGAKVGDEALARIRTVGDVVAAALAHTSPRA